MSHIVPRLTSHSETTQPHSPREEIKLQIPKGLVKERIDDHVKYIENESPRTLTLSSPRRPATPTTPREFNQKINTYTLNQDSPRGFSVSDDYSPRPFSGNLFNEHVNGGLQTPIACDSSSESLDIQPMRPAPRKRGSSILRRCQKTFANLKQSMVLSDNRSGSSNIRVLPRTSAYILPFEPLNTVIPIYSIGSTIDSTITYSPFKNPFEDQLVQIYRMAYALDSEGYEIASSDNYSLILNEQGTLCWAPTGRFQADEGKFSIQDHLTDDPFFKQVNGAFEYVMSVIEGTQKLKYTRINEAWFLHSINDHGIPSIEPKSNVRSLVEIVSKLTQSVSGKWLLSKSLGFKQCLINFYCDIFYSEKMNYAQLLSGFMDNNRKEILFLNTKTNFLNDDIHEGNDPFKEAKEISDKFIHEISFLRGNPKAYIRKLRMRRDRRELYLTHFVNNQIAETIQQVGQPISIALGKKRIEFASEMKKLLVTSCKMLYKGKKMERYLSDINQVFGGDEATVNNWDALNLLVKQIVAEPLEKERQLGRFTLPRT